MMERDLDRLIKFAEMMLGQLKAAQTSARAAAFIKKMSYPEAMMHDIQAGQFQCSIAIGEEALMAIIYLT